MTELQINNYQEGWMVEVDFHIFVVSNREECQLPETYKQYRSYFPDQSYRNLKSQKHM